MDTMSTHDLVIDLIETVAPGAAAGDVDPHARMRDAMDIDSLDFLRIVQAIHDRTGVDIPESDYGSVESLDGLVEYVALRTVTQR